jgi:sec-independent protein translocase protein TatA
MLGNIFGGDGAIVLLVALVVIFGGSQLPKIARNVGGAGREFRKAQREAEEEDRQKESAAVTAGPIVSSPVTPPAPVVAAPAVATPTPLVATAAPVDDDKVTLSRSELEALLDERIKRQQSAN